MGNRFRYLRWTGGLAGLAAVVLCLVNCGSRHGQVFDTVYFTPEYADGFEILEPAEGASRVVRVKAAWQGADSTAMDLFIARDGERPPVGFVGQVISEEARRIVAMSSSYIAMLEILGAVERTVAVSGIDFISNDYINSHRDSITDVGNEANADFEKLVAVNPDLVLLYGINSSSAMETRLRSLGIPFIYMGEYLESSPLGRAEWLIALGEIVGRREMAQTKFSEIEQKYLQLKSRIEAHAGAADVTSSSSRPKVMLNTPYGDLWYMASGGTAFAAMIADAGAEYVYKDNYTNQAKPIDIEKAFTLASQADFWLNTGTIGSILELVRAYPKFAGIPCVNEGKVYNCDRRLTAGGGNDFWESGSVRPDIVLEDLARIFHPEVFSGKEAAEGDGLRGVGGQPAREGTDDVEAELYYYRRLK